MWARQMQIKPLKCLAKSTIPRKPVNASSWRPTPPPKRRRNHQSVD